MAQRPGRFFFSRLIFSTTGRVRNSERCVYSTISRRSIFPNQPLFSCWARGRARNHCEEHESSSESASLKVHPRVRVCPHVLKIRWSLSCRDEVIVDFHCYKLQRCDLRYLSYFLQIYPRQSLALKTNMCRLGFHMLTHLLTVYRYTFQGKYYEHGRYTPSPFRPVNKCIRRGDTVVYAGRNSKLPLPRVRSSHRGVFVA